VSDARHDDKIKALKVALQSEKDARAATLMRATIAESESRARSATVAALVAALEAAKSEHVDWGEPSSCATFSEPPGECNCGTDAHNAAIQAAIDAAKERT
jgi:hypothetical protein